MLASIGCSSPKEIDVTRTDPSVVLTLKNTGIDIFTIGIEPDNAASFEYAVSADGDRKAFVNGTMPGIVKVESGDQKDVEFTGLASEATYTVYARAFDGEGNSGPVAQLRVTTVRGPIVTDKIATDMQYVTDSSAGITITSSTDFYRLDYAIGKPEDKAAFEAGSLDGIEKRFEYTDHYTANIFDLEPDTDYVFFVRGYDRTDFPTITFERPFKTYATDGCPAVAIATEIDILEGNFSYTPNALCGKMIVALHGKGAYDGLVESPASHRGNIMQFLPAMVETGLATLVEGSYSATVNMPPLDAEDMLATYYTMYGDPVLQTDYEFETYVLLYDGDGNPFGVQKKIVSTGEYDPDLPAAVVTATIKNISAYGATYEFSIDDSTFGFFFDTVDADWYDNEIKTSEDFYENYLRDTFFERGYWWRHHDNPAPYTDRSAAPGMRCYLAICPLNANGVSDPDWGKLYLKEFTTLSN